jgi:hypothetical protein
MAGNSTVAGYLSPAASPAPMDDDVLDQFLHDLIMGVSGLPGEKVLPRWQPEPPTQLDRDTDWMAFGVMGEDPDTYAAMIQGDSSTEMQRHENIDVLVSSYGAHARANLKLLADGLLLEQNRAVLSANAMGLVQTGNIVTAPTIVKDLWLRRFDMHITIRRLDRRVYPVETVDSMTGILDTEVIQTSIIVNPPAP